MRHFPAWVLIIAISCVIGAHANRIYLGSQQSCASRGLADEMQSQAGAPMKVTTERELREAA